LSLGALGAFMSGVYPSIQSTIDEVTKNYPTGLREAFGVQAMNTVEGYIHAEMFSLIVPLAIGLFAIRTVAGATVGAEESGYLDTVLSLPLSRRVLMIGSYVVMAFVTAAIMATVGLLIFVVGRLVGTHISAGRVAAGAIGVWPLAMFCGGLSGLASGVLHSSRAVTGAATGALVGMYALDLAGRMATRIEPLRWVSAFRYYGAPIRDGIDIVAFLGLTFAGVLLLGLGAILFERRDLRR
jgi:ABC-2 type transport system permease protein